MKDNLAKLAAAGLSTLAATASAMAGSVTQPGETAGIALGAPLPPGFYFLDTSNWGVRDIGGVKELAGGTIPFMVWATPWKVLGARVSLLAAAPALEVGTTSGIVPIRGIGPVPVPATYNESMFNPFIGGSLAWDLGGGLGFSYILGAYIGVNDLLADKSSFLINRGTLSYVANGWNLTGSAVVGAALDTVNPLTNPNAHPDYLNVDLTATKAFGKWEVGAVGFYSTDLDSKNQVALLYQKQSQFALGGLVGYDWGELKTQVYLTRDVYQQNYNGFDTRVWGRVLVPLGDPFEPASPGMMFHK